MAALADGLIEKCCGTHSLGHIFAFMLETYGATERAKAEFIKFLEGQWSDEWREAAQQAIAEDRPRSSHNGRHR